jgi:hypothetical protein
MGGDRGGGALRLGHLVLHIEHVGEVHRDPPRRQRVTLVQRQLAVHQDHGGGHRPRGGETGEGAGENLVHVERLRCDLS